MSQISLKNDFELKSKLVFVLIMKLSIVSYIFCFDFVLEIAFNLNETFDTLL
jgi:hypothetical protein